MSKIKKVHRTGALGMLMAEGGLPTVDTISSDNIKQNQGTPNDQYMEIDPKLARNWHFNDRPEAELGDIAAFAKELSDVGQQQPCIVRPIDHKDFKFEVIAGERRWRAARHADIKLKVISRILDDHAAALVQAAENAQRKDLSDYAKGMSFYALLKKDILTREDIESKLGISNAQVSRLLSFADIPQEVIDAIKDFSNVTARTAAEIRSIANKSPRHIEALVSLADKIASGSLGGIKIQSQIKKLLETRISETPVIREAIGSNNLPLFTWKQKNKNNVTITLSKEALASLNGKLPELEKEIMESIDNFIYKNQ